MLDWNRVLKRIEDELCLPNHVLEKTNEEIKDYLINSALGKFTDYYPDKTRYVIDNTNTDMKVPDRKSEYFIFDPDDRSIYGITEFMVQRGTDIIFGRPVLPVMSWEQVMCNELGNYKADNALLFSQWNYNFEFIHPNIIRISPEFTDTIATIEYERSHDPELSTIPTMVEDMFVDLCLGMFMKNIGRIRTRYQNIRTSFGEIELRGDDLKSEGTEIFNTAIEDLKRSVMTNIIVDRG